MLENFFSLNGKPGRIDSLNELMDHLKRSDHLKDVIYAPDDLSPERPKNRFKNKSFQNVSFSKTKIKGAVFLGCTFKDCLFIGTEFESCEFHSCTFTGCNPYKASFAKTYMNPTLFARVLDPKEHSNIGVILFQRLMVNFVETKQHQFAKLAEYYFMKWKRFQLCYDYRNKKVSAATFLKKWIPDKLYDSFAGYGLRTGPFLIWTVLFFILILLANYGLWQYLGMRGDIDGIGKPNLIMTFYYTVVTISTLGYGDITPSSSLGMAVAGLEALLGIIWLAILASIIIKKVVR